MRCTNHGLWSKISALSFQMFRTFVNMQIVCCREEIQRTNGGLSVKGRLLDQNRQMTHLSSMTVIDNLGEKSTELLDNKRPLRTRKKSKRLFTHKQLPHWLMGRPFPRTQNKFSDLCKYGRLQGITATANAIYLLLRKPISEKSEFGFPVANQHLVSREIIVIGYYDYCNQY